MGAPGAPLVHATGVPLSNPRGAMEAWGVAPQEIAAAPASATA